MVEEFLQTEHSRQWAVPRKRPAEPAVQVVQPRATTKQGKHMVTDSITGLEGVRVLSAGDKRAPQLNPVDPRWQIWVLSGKSNLRIAVCGQIWLGP